MALPPPPHPDRPRQDTLPLSDPEGRAFHARWLAHVEAGRIGNNPKMSDEARETILANERLMFGRQRTILD